MAVKILKRQDLYAIYLEVEGETWEELPKIILNKKEIKELEQLLQQIEGE